MKNTKSKEGNSVHVRARTQSDIRPNAALLARIDVELDAAEAGLIGEPLERAAKLIIICTLRAMVDAMIEGRVAVSQGYQVIYAAHGMLPRVSGKQGNEIEQKGW
jgi:hypothetical protein